MRIVLQKVSGASVTVDKKMTGKIDTGLLLLTGFEDADMEEDLDWSVRKVINMRIFLDENGKMNKSLLDVDGAILVVSQFTLHASIKKGNRPSFIYSAKPDYAEKLYEKFINKLETATGKTVQTGKFGAMMQVDLCNEGPVTIIVDSKSRA